MPGSSARAGLPAIATSIIAIAARPFTIVPIEKMDAIFEAAFSPRLDHAAEVLAAIFKPDRFNQ
jgi:hypothetical protein